MLEELITIFYFYFMNWKNHAGTQSHICSVQSKVYSLTVTSHEAGEEGITATGL